LVHDRGERKIDVFFVEDRKMKKVLVLMLVLALTTASAQALVVGDYSSGVAAAAGAIGAANPTTQGWGESPGVGANGWTTPLDSGNGGWRIMDGTSRANDYYQKDLSEYQGNGLSYDWTATWTFAMNADMINGSTFLNDWFVGANEGRQATNYVWIEQAGGNRFIMTHIVSGGVIQVTDGTNTYAIGTHGLSQEIDTFGATTTETIMDFVTLTLSYDANTDIATLSEGATVYGAIVAGSGTSDRLVMGSGSSGGTGSMIYNAFNVDSTIPEPATMLLLGLGGLLIRKRK
jgi:hypothetical protein